jgi:hypothetical protein
VTCGGAWLGGWPGHFGGTSPLRGERPVERVAGPAAGLGDQVAVQVHGGRDRLVAEPAGHLRDRHTLSKGGAGEGVPQVVEGRVGRQPGPRRQPIMIAE